MTDRINELKKKGWVNLNAEEREEYRALKSDAASLLPITKEEEIKEEETKKLVYPTSTVDTVMTTEEDQAITGIIFTPYKFLKNVKFQGQYYSTGDRLPDCTKEDITMLLASHLIII